MERHHDSSDPDLVAVSQREGGSNALVAQVGPVLAPQALEHGLRPGDDDAGVTSRGLGRVDHTAASSSRPKAGRISSTAYFNQDPERHLQSACGSLSRARMRGGGCSDLNQTDVG